MTKTILLTGATGFLGSHLLKALLNNTRYNLIIIKRSFSITKRIDEQINDPRIKIYDIDEVELSDIFKENIINSIIHCATEYGRNDDSSYKVLNTNLMLPIKLLDLSIKNGVELFINTDSYFNKENMSYQYLLNYSLSKKSLNIWLKHFSKKLKVINMVLEHIYGEDDSDSKFVSYLIRKIAIDKDKSIDLTYGDQKRDFIYIEDVVSAYIKVLEYSELNQFRHKTFEVGNGAAFSVKYFAEKIKDVSASKTILNFGKIPYREDEIMYSVADNIDLLNIGWKPLIDIETGLMQTIEEVKNANKR